MRLARVLTALAIGASALLPHTGAQAVQSLAYTFVVPCADSDGVSSSDLGVTLPSGWYAYTIAGVCTHAQLGYTLPVSTPCVVEGIPVPCVNTTVGNLPGAVCHTSIGSVATDCPVPTVRVTSCGTYSVQVNGVCANSQAGFVYQGAVNAPMTARFVDTVYADNVGYLLVTVTFTPL